MSVFDAYVCNNHDVRKSGDNFMEKYDIKNLRDLIGEEEHPDEIHYSETGFGFLKFEVFIDNVMNHYVIIFDEDLNVTYREVGKNLIGLGTDFCTNLFIIQRLTDDNKEINGVIDARGNEILPCVYADIWLDTDGDDEPSDTTPIYASAYDNMCYLFNRQGKQLGEGHKYIKHYDNYGFFEFRDEDGSGILDRKGNVVFKFNYDKCKIVSSHQESETLKYFILRDFNYNFGIADKDGKVIVPPENNDYTNMRYIGNDKFFAESRKHGIQIIDLKKKN